MLSIQNLSVNYGQIRAVRDVSLEVGAGECVALIGANGAGKTSTICAIAGLAKCSGTVALDGTAITTVSVEDRVRARLSMTPEGRHVFTNLTVDENLTLGAALQPDRRKKAQDRDFCFGLFPRLAERITQMAGTLSGGEQQMLAIARSLMSRPRVLMLDEPSLGLAPKIVDTIFHHIAELKRGGLTILLVEQNMHRALSGLLAGIAAIFIVARRGSIEPDMGFRPC